MGNSAGVLPNELAKKSSHFAVYFNEPVVAYCTTRGALLFVSPQRVDQTHSAEAVPAAEADRLAHERQTHAALQRG